MQDDDDDAEMDDAPTSSASNERANVAAFMLGRQRINDDEDDDAEEAAALAEAAAARKERRKNEKESNRAIYGLVERAEALAYYETRIAELVAAKGFAECDTYLLFLYAYDCITATMLTDVPSTKAAADDLRL